MAKKKTTPKPRKPAPTRAKGKAPKPTKPKAKAGARPPSKPAPSKKPKPKPKPKPKAKPAPKAKPKAKPLPKTKTKAPSAKKPTAAPKSAPKPTKTTQPNKPAKPAAAPKAAVQKDPVAAVRKKPATSNASAKSPVAVATPAPTPTAKPAPTSAVVPAVAKEHPHPAARNNGPARAGKSPKPAPGSNGSADETPDHFEPDLTVEQLQKVKTGLKKKDLDAFRALLLEERAELIGDIKGLDGARNNYGGELANVPLHMADAGSENFDREFTLGMAEKARVKLRLLNEALLRIERGYYGVCLDSGRPIEHARLEYEPWTRYSIEVARHRERLGLAD